MSVKLIDLNKLDKFVLENQEDVPEDERPDHVYMKLANQGYEFNSVSLTTARLYCFNKSTMINPVRIDIADINLLR